MCRSILLVLSLTACGSLPDGNNVPSGYERVYGQDFAFKGGRYELDVSDPSAWEWHLDAEARQTWFEAARGSDYQPPHRSPHTIALVRNLEVGDFVFELDVMNTAPASRGGHRDLCFFFGWQDPANFYYVHLAPGPDDHAHNAFVVDDAARRRVGDVAAEGIDWGEGWHHVRLERTLEDGLIRVYFDDMQVPVIEATDRSHGWGRLGFGTFDDSGRYTNVQVFAPEMRRVEHENPFE